MKSWILDDRWIMKIGIEDITLSAIDAKKILTAFDNQIKQVRLEDGRIYNTEAIQVFEPIIEKQLKKLFSEGGWVCKHGYIYHNYEGYHVFPYADCWENKGIIIDGEGCSEQPVTKKISQGRVEARRKLALAEGPRLEDGANKVLPQHMLAYKLSKHYQDFIKMRIHEEKNYQLPAQVTWEDFQKEKAYFNKLDGKYEEEQKEIINSFKNLLPEAVLMKYSSFIQ